MIENRTAEQIPLPEIINISPALQKKLQQIGIFTLFDTLFHLPFRYEDRTRITPIADLIAGEKAQTEGIIEAVEVSGFRKKRLQLLISDNNRDLRVIFFNFFPSMLKSLEIGKKIRLFGEIRDDGYGRTISHPEYTVFSADKQLALSDSLTPVYSTTKSLTQEKLRQIIASALALLKKNPQLLPELIKQELLPEEMATDIAIALEYLHNPPPDTSLPHMLDNNHPANKRVVIEELLAHHLAITSLKEAIISGESSFTIADNHNLHQKFLNSLHFDLTNAQKKVIAEINHNLQSTTPMLRLVQGDVGSGKTVVAAIAACNVVEQGLQVAIMAPTELLAEQHYRNFRNWLEPLGIKLLSLTGKMKKSVRNQNLSDIYSGKCNIIIGTHALFQDDVKYKNLALVIVDEQHRFGVHQRLSLKKKGEDNGKLPHQLIMTATPIPRTLSMIAYADMDVSIIDELPPGRTPVKTVAIPNSRRDEIIERIKIACSSGKQVYWVCTMIGESEKIECQAAEETFTNLQQLMPDISIDLVHGRMKADEKEKALSEFSKNKTQLLVATTVIEVGVDVPNASLMIIENSERLGLAQLHQLRGRVGRGSVESSCALLYKAPLTNVARSRLGIMRETNDGFKIARKDLELRGPGEVLGTRQAGAIDFHVADLNRDKKLIELIPAISGQIKQQQPDIIPLLINRWLGDTKKYGDV